MWNALSFFLIRIMVYRKNSVWKKKKFSVYYVKIIELHFVHTWRHMNMSSWNKGCNDIYKNVLLKHFEKNSFFT